MEEFYLPSNGAGRIHCALWTPETAPRAVVQIIHGIAEYVPRYAGFAAFLNAHGLLATGEDHMGHGKSHGTEPCHFSGGWGAAVDDSMELLREVSRRLEGAGYRLGNLDATIIAQRPKLAPHIEQMRRNIAGALHTGLGNISVKATTEERLGFTGSGEGIAAHAVCLIE